MNLTNLTISPLYQYLEYLQLNPRIKIKFYD
jgi:hypothetical protein